jgi:hypothetical protein
VRDTRDVRASGLQGDASPEIIEILDDDTNAFGDRAPSHTMHDTNGPRWIGPAAAAALVALIGYGVATSASTPSVPKASPVTSSSVLTTITISPPATAPSPPVPYYAATPPDGYSVQFADVQPYAATFDTTYNLWATRGSTATSGSWFSVNVSSYAGSLYGDNSYRTMADDLELVISPPSGRPGGITSVMFNTSGRFTVQLAAFSVGVQQLIDLAASISTDGSSIQIGKMPVGPGEYRLISTVDPWFKVLGAQQLGLAYGTAEARPHYLNLNVGKAKGRTTIDQKLLPFVLNRPIRFAMGPATWGVAGDFVGGDGSALALWIDRDNIVSVSGNLSITDLIDVAKSVHQVSADEWSSIQHQVNANGENNGTYSEGVPAPVSFGTDADGRTWTISASFATYGLHRQINWEWSNNGNAWEPTDAAQIRSVVQGQRTYVLADLPRAVAATALLRITRNGLDPIDVPFNDIDPSADRTLAAYAFSEPVAFAAQIVAPDGTVIATWPTP